MTELNTWRRRGSVSTIQGCGAAGDASGYHDDAVSLTKDGRNFLESTAITFTSTRRRSTRAWGANGNSNTTFRSRAYEQAEDRLLDRGAHIERLMLLDAVLAVGDVEWLTTAAEKRSDE
jgi:hypothetical protein